MVIQPCGHAIHVEVLMRVASYVAVALGMKCRPMAVY